MKIDDYQKGAATTVIYSKRKGLEYVILGLVGEAGEIANIYKKVIRDDNEVLTEEKREKLISELGDLNWYSNCLATELGVNMSDILQQNLDKLTSRKERGVLQGSGDNR